MKHLVLFGDSLLGDCSKRHTDSLEEKLGKLYEVYNCANGGWDTSDLLRKAPLIGKLPADIVILSVGTNDASPWRHIELDRFKSNLNEITANFAHCRLIVLLPPPVNESRQPKNKFRSNDIMQRYAEALKSHCRQNNLEYLDSWQYFQPYLEPEDRLHSEDGVHFTDEGYGLVFDGLVGVINSTKESAA